MNITATTRLVSTVALALACHALPALASDPVSILFVGNSYTFGRVAPVLGYNAANVHDLTAGFNTISATGTNSFPVNTPGQGWFEPHNWGGVPGIFKKMTDQAGLNYDVSLSTRNAATLRGQFLNTANAAWDLRGNVASRSWDVVVLQEQSDAALPAGRGKNANLATFNAYVNQFEKFIHNGTAYSYTETSLFGSLANCQATGLSTGSCNLSRSVPANPNANAATRIFLQQTWARPDMVEAHKTTTPDLTTADGRPIVDTTLAGGAAGTPATLYYTDTGLAGMTKDLHDAFYNRAASNSGITGVIPVGDAFLRAVQKGLALGSGFYGLDGLYLEPTDGTINLWWLDRTHASKYGSYLSALVNFGRITGIDPRTLGINELSAFDLGIAPDIAGALQFVAADQLGFVVPLPASAALLASGVVVLLGWSRRSRRVPC